jgi:hypothetical protein
MPRVVSAGCLVLAVLYPATAHAPRRPKLVATASSMEAADTSAREAVDGDMSTRWSSAWSDAQWLRVDMGTIVSICRVRLFWEAAFARGYQIQVSDDALRWTTLYETTTGDGDTDDLLLRGSGRYVQLNGTSRGTSYGYSLWEMEIYTGAGKASRTPVGAR